MKGFIIDLDGTLYRGNEVIEHAASFVQFVKKRNLPVLFLTNNSTRSPQETAEKCHAMGIDAEPGEVVTTSQAAASYVKEQGAKRVYCIGESGLREALLEARLELVEQGTPATGGKTEKIDVVVQGLDRQVDYRKFAGAVSALLGGAGYILTNPDVLLPSESGLMPGAGALAGVLEKAGGVKPLVIGKPEKIIMEYAINRLQLPAEEITVIGDNLKTDIAGGSKAGCRTVLVMTGVTTTENVQLLLQQSGVKPDMIVRNLAELVDTLKTNQHNLT